MKNLTQNHSAVLSTSHFLPSIRENPVFQKAWQIAKDWVDIECEVSRRGRRPTDDLYLLIFIAVVAWESVLINDSPWQSVVESYLQEVGLSKEEARHWYFLIKFQHRKNSERIEFNKTLHGIAPWFKASVYHTIEAWKFYQRLLDDEQVFDGLSIKHQVIGYLIAQGIDEKTAKHATRYIVGWVRC